MAKAKIRTHNEWFRTVSLGNRKSCPNCRAKLEQGESVWAWGEYHNAKWHNVKYFCKGCFIKEVQEPLLAHAGPCGCKIELQFRSERQPSWLTLEKELCVVSSNC